MPRSLETPAVADSTQDIGEDGFHEIQLSGKQLVFLFMATTVVSVVIFLCGVQVGRGVRAQQLEPSSDPLASAVPLVSEPEPAPLPAAELPPTEAPVPADEPDAPLGAASRPDAGPGSADPAPERAEAPAVRAAAGGAGPAPSSTSTASSPVAAPPPPRTTPAAGSGERSGTWVVQVHALRDRAAANTIVQRLSRKGYSAYLATGGANGIYRVHVGRFKDREEAERIVRRLKIEEQFQPWITR